MRASNGLRDRRPSLRELEALHAMVELRKTTSAAHRLGLSQPAVSRALHDLEQRTGRKLFRREGGRLVATAEGIQLYHDSRPVFQALDRLGRDLPATGTGERLRLIAPPTIAHRFLPPLLAAFQGEEPCTHVLIEVGITADVVARLADGAFDIGVTDAQLHHPSVVFDPFRRAASHAVIRADDPLAERDVVTPQDLAGRAFIALTRRFSVRSALEAVFREAGAEPRVVVEAATAAIAYELVREGVGVSLLNPFPLALRRDADMAFRPFLPRIGFETSFVLSTAAPPSSAARRFMDFVRRHQAEDGYSTPIR